MAELVALPSKIHEASQNVTSGLISEMGTSLAANRVANFIYELETMWGSKFNRREAAKSLDQLIEAAVHAKKILQK